MRFTHAQVAMFSQGLPFVHVSPDTYRRRKAQEDFFEACGELDIDPSTAPYNYRFMLCVLQGQSSEHVPVLFLEDEADMDQRALNEALFIPAPIKGSGPMVVR